MTKGIKYPNAIYNWTEDERAREKLLKLEADKFSDRIISVCEPVGIKISDYIVIDDNSYFSFFNEGGIKCQKFLLLKRHTKY